MAKSPEEMGYTSGFHSKYWFFNYWTGNNGYDTSKPVDFTNYVDNINFPNDAAFQAQRWLFPGDRFAAEWVGFIQINTPGIYEFSTKSDDGSRLFIND